MTIEQATERRDKLQQSYEIIYDELVLAEAELNRLRGSKYETVESEKYGKLAL